MLTTWPVLAEACHFLPERTQIRFLRWAAAGGLGMVELHETALAEIADWKEKYRDLPMDLADASLLWWRNRPASWTSSRSTCGTSPRTGCRTARRSSLCY